MNVIVEREKKLLELEKSINDLRTAAVAQPSLSTAIAALQDEYAKIQRDVFGSMSPWQKVNMARHPNRPVSSDYIAALDSFDELHGDRHFRDDPAVIAGFGKLGGRSIIVIGQQRGRDTKENLRRNFGMVTPEGYRKIKRLIDLGSRLGLPVVTFIDTKGADPGIASEEHAQSEAIAQCLFSLTMARVPVVATVIGEGGSGGALALGIADHVVMLEHSVYTVASPEGCAAILWGDAAKAEEAAARLKLTSQDSLGFGIIDEIIPEPIGGAHRDAAALVATTLHHIGDALARLSAKPADELVEERYRKYRRIGAWQVERQEAAAISG
ncbi:MAG: acetyl-CoA carboxylase carboxyltransferase subunit alpha [Candidatus Eremiobacteraeota bacterium]|nr:acetyl-CoA carboxylase carboxyltransferase subunit alpha [Candidatus Eremiobacteraeota bacterium]